MGRERAGACTNKDLLPPATGALRREADRAPPILPFCRYAPMAHHGSLLSGLMAKLPGRRPTLALGARQLELGEHLGAGKAPARGAPLSTPSARR